MTPDSSEGESLEVKTSKGYETGFIDGRAAGLKRSELLWIVPGCGSGLVIGSLGLGEGLCIAGGCIGGGGAWVYARNSADYPHSIPKGNIDYVNGYKTGYREATKLRKSQRVLTGCLIGAALAGIGMVIFWSSIDVD